MNIKMKKRFETIFASQNEYYLLRGKLHKDERFSLALIKTDLTDRWYNDFTPLFIHKIAQQVGNIKKIMVFWEILSNYTEDNDIGYKIKIHSENKEEDNQKSTIYLIIEETTHFSKVSYPLPLEHLPFTVDEFQENLRFFYNKIQCLESTRLLHEKEISDLKTELSITKTSNDHLKIHTQKKLLALQKKIESEKQKVFNQNLLLSSIKPKAKASKQIMRNSTKVSISELSTDF